jgi:hypothetical protein
LDDEDFLGCDLLGWCFLDIVFGCFILFAVVVYVMYFA